MKRTVLGRAALALVAALTLITVPFATPASAAACTSAAKGALWRGPFSVQLFRQSDCRYYARLVIDDPNYGIGLSISWKVERLELTSQGYFVTDARQRSKYWSAGTFNTESVAGYVNTSPYQDWHHACYSLAGGAWQCTGWESY